MEPQSSSARPSISKPYALIPILHSPFSQPTLLRILLRISQKRVLHRAAGFYLVPCTLRSEAPTTNFGLRGATIIWVPFHEAILRVSSTVCVLRIAAAASTGNEWILGDTMLRGAYGERFQHSVYVGQNC
jgi:hypothetical protein